ncbi:MAG: phosphatidylserine decarboxylase family protein [Bacteroidetes bacterium]|nr:phosphatidylserine decarboxylase family protein [Bacteroidota bacterium]MCL6101462.1 phosphatidylserine decarboxylase family protein [Bacteroidota bacterium]
MRLHKEGYSIISVAIIIWLAVNYLVGLTGETAFRVFILLSTLPLLILTIRFFRNPHRKITAASKSVLSPADGTIVAIEETTENEYFKDKRLQVSVFMSIYNVHINWIPVPGEVTYFKHHNGHFMAAYLPKSSTLNERSTTVIRMADGTEVLVRQIAGAIAKRIITYATVGKQVSQNDELGFIRFGSRVDLFLPVGTKVNVELCQEVIGSQTILAEF